MILIGLASVALAACSTPASTAVTASGSASQASVTSTTPSPPSTTPRTTSGSPSAKPATATPKATSARPKASRTPTTTTPPVVLDHRYSTCKEAKAHGLGPYYRGQDPEYYWYIDRDKDGIVCE
jgi:hypothetical protein